MTDDRTSFDDDEYGWAIQLAERLRQRRSLDEAERDDLIEHFDRWVADCRRQVSETAILLLQYLLLANAARPVPSSVKQFGVAVQQRGLREILRKLPGLRADAPDLFLAAFPAARRNASVMAGWPEDQLPATCPWTLDEALAVWWPASARPRREPSVACELNLEGFRFVQHRHDEDPANLAHFTPTETGLPQSVWLSRAGGEHATDRIPVRIAGPQDPASVDLLLDWIKRHEVAIHDYWRGRIGTVDLMHALDLFSQP